MSQNYDNKLKNFIASHVPQFVSADHPMFVSFLEAYFEWLQTQEDRKLSPLSLLSQRDIDDSVEKFVSLFREEFLKNFPYQLAFDDVTGAKLDERKLMKIIRSFYKAKGTEKSYKFLFNVLYNTYSELYYPKTDILKLSDGKWNTKFTMKTTSINGRSLFDYIGGNLSQRDGYGKLLAYAVIRDMVQYTEGGYEVTEYTLSNLFGVFKPGGRVELRNTGTDSVLTESVYGILTGFNIVSTGEQESAENDNRWKLYKIGDRVTVSRRNLYDELDGVGAVGTVSEIDYLQSPVFSETGELDARGPIKKIKVLNAGVNYRNADKWRARIVSVGGRNAVVEPIFGAVLEDEGFYTNDDGMPSSKKRLQDNYFYQNYSYVVKTDVSFDLWIESIKKLIHPSGMAVFAQQYLLRETGYRLDDRNTVVPCEDPIVGHYTPYRFRTHENLRNNSKGIDLYPQGYNPNAGEVVEWGIWSHNPNAAPGGALSAGIVPAIHNIWCPSGDHTTLGQNTVFAESNVTGSTGELMAKHETWENCSSAGPACCINTPYWIIYTHPNSRGYSSIPQTTDTYRVYLGNFYSLAPKFPEDMTVGWVPIFTVMEDEGEHAQLSWIRSLKMHQELTVERIVKKKYETKVDGVVGSARVMARYCQPLTTLTSQEWVFYAQANPPQWVRHFGVVYDYGSGGQPLFVWPGTNDIGWQTQATYHFDVEPISKHFLWKNPEEVYEAITGAGEPANAINEDYFLYFQGTTDAFILRAKDGSKPPVMIAPIASFNLLVGEPGVFENERLLRNPEYRELVEYLREQGVVAIAPYSVHPNCIQSPNKFMHIRLNDFFKMPDGTMSHSFVPGFNKFEGYETDDFAPDEGQYSSPSSGVLLPGMPGDTAGGGVFWSGTTAFERIGLRETLGFGDGATPNAPDNITDTTQ